MVRWLRWHCPTDTGFEIRVMAVWGRARYLSVTEAPHNTDFHTWMGKKHFCFFQTAGNRTPNSGVKGSGANHYPRAPAPDVDRLCLSPFQQTRDIHPMLFQCWPYWRIRLGLHIWHHIYMYLSDFNLHWLMPIGLYSWHHNISVFNLYWLILLFSMHFILKMPCDV